MPAAGSPQATYAQNRTSFPARTGALRAFRGRHWQAGPVMMSPEEPVTPAQVEAGRIGIVSAMSLQGFTPKQLKRAARYVEKADARGLVPRQMLEDGGPAVRALLIELFTRNL
jgi:hypothetical protein